MTKSSMNPMEDGILFSEKQRFTQWWLWVLLLGIDTMMLHGAYEQIIDGEQFGDKPMSNPGLIITVGFVLLLTGFFVIMRLETQIRKDGISVRFFPFDLTFRHYPWNIISKSYIRQYSPITEYGGWGLKGSNSNKALNISGNMGLQLEFNDNKKLLIGTNKPEELGLVLTQMGHLKDEY